jgi:DNA repair exonuclease SbcCD ATPase subunit
LNFRCAHISDVHWRGLTRHEEYRESFAALFDKLRELDPNTIFIGGDIVHTKTQGISPELIDNLNWWFTEMASICPVHVILGNHDGLILNKDRQDAISPIINALGNDRIHLYKKSGTYPTGIPGFNWCVFSCFDEEGWPEVRPVAGDVNIATYHGSVVGSLTDVDWEIEGEVDLEFFKGYDFGFLGDIHRLQYLDKAKRVAYPGSTIQQNYGEAPGKGFLFWDIESKDVYQSTFYEVPHRHPFVTVDWAGSVASTVRECEKHPNGSRFRIRKSVLIPNSEMKQLFGELRETKSAAEIVFKNEVDESTSGASLSDSSCRPEDLRAPSTHHRLLREYYANADITPDEWRRLDDLAVRYLSTSKHSDLSRNIKWSINRMEFDNMFSYGKGNVINFDELRGITGIFGRNRCGKSSIPGTIMYALYNATDRGPMSNLHVINMRKGHCESRIDLTANGKRYRVERQTVRKTNRSGDQSAVTNLNFFHLDEGGNPSFDLNGEQRRETEKALREIVGTSDDFLLTSLASQGEMNNFIKYKASQRKSILTKFLDLEVFEEMLQQAKSDSAGLKARMSGAPDRDWETTLQEMAVEKSDLEQKLDTLKVELEDLRNRHQQAQINLATHKDSSLVTQEDVDAVEQELTKKVASLELQRSELDSVQKKITERESKILSIRALKEQFPIDELKERHAARQDLEKNLLQLEHLRDVERAKVSQHKKAIKLLEEVPCGDAFPKCKFIRNSHESKSQIESQKLVVEGILDRLQGIQKSLASLDKENLQEKLNRYNGVLEKERDLQVSLSNLQVDLTRTLSRISVLETVISDMSRELESMRSRIVSTVEAERLQILKRQARELNTKVNEKDAERMSAAQMIGALESKIERTLKEREKHQQTALEWRTYELFMSAVSKNGIPLKIMSTQLPAINSEIAKILQGVAGFIVELEADPSTNDMEIYLNYGDSRRIIECGSGMEKMISSLAIRVALINITSLPKSDILIIDEGFGALDDTNVEACTRLLDSLKKWFKTILVISHVDAVKDSVDNALDITHHGMDAAVVYE